MPFSNNGLAKDGVSYCANSFVVTESSVLHVNICDNKPAHLKLANF